MGNLKKKKNEHLLQFRFVYLSANKISRIASLNNNIDFTDLNLKFISH